MNQKPIHLSIEDFTQTRLSGYHAHWPVDPDTTARLERIRQIDPYAKPKFRDRYRNYQPHYFLFRILTLALLIGLILWIVQIVK